MPMLVSPQPAEANNFEVPSPDKIGLCQAIPGGPNTTLSLVLGALRVFEGPSISSQ